MKGTEFLETDGLKGSTSYLVADWLIITLAYEESTIAD
jgi:hypothetical protein